MEAPAAAGGLPRQIRRISAAQTWPLRHAVMWPDQPLDFIKVPGDGDAATIHLGVFLGDAGGSPGGGPRTATVSKSDGALIFFCDVGKQK